jgi:hypothetical protein
MLLLALFADIYKVAIFCLVSLAHGGASMILFLIIGSIRRARTTRLTSLLLQETKFS